MSNIIKIKRKTTSGLPSLAQIEVGEGVLNEVDNTITYRKSDNSFLTFSQGGGSSIISSSASFNFGSKSNDIVIVTVPNLLLTNVSIKSFSYIPIETATTSIDDFSLNGLNFNIENIINNVSFDIRATALNEAIGIYQIKYIITY